MSNDKHEYDGIVELDNQLPQWWRVLFYVTIVFAVGYYVHYELGDGQSIQQEFEQAMAQNEQKQKSGQPAGGPEFDDAKLAAFMKDQAQLAKGHAVFSGRCVSCHGAAGGGGIGPNLTDNYWINGDGKLVTIAGIVKNGEPAKGMPPWGPILTTEELYAVVAYVKSIKGTSPAGGKEPQGNLVKE